MSSKRTLQRRRAKELSRRFQPYQTVQDVPNIALQHDEHSSEPGCLVSADLNESLGLSSIHGSVHHNGLRDLSRFNPVILHSKPDISNESLSFEKDFLKVVVKRRLGRAVLNDILSVFKRHNIGDFPIDSRSCLKTLRKVDVVDMPPGKYFHFGLSFCLNQVLKFQSLEDHNLKIQLNIDGLPLAKSSLSCFWPILGRVVSPFSSSVFVIGIYFSNCKPSKPACVSQFLSFLVGDLSIVHEQGIAINNVTYSVEIHSIVCDAPARQFIKCIKPHTGYDSCEKCTVRGVYVKGKGVRFLENDSELRTDYTFRAKMHASHHLPTLESPLCEIKIDMIKDFPLDYMHLVLLGIVRRFLRLWLGISKVKGSGFKKLNPSQIAKMSRRHVVSSLTVPSEFQRRPRSFSFAGVFKASEFRTFLCYTSPLVLLKMFENRKFPFYSHFMMLVVAMRILLSPSQNQEQVEFSRSCITSFVSLVETFYGSAHAVYNVHSLIHLPDDYTRFGYLDSVSSFPYESFLGSLKMNVKGKGKELEQVVNRLHERWYILEDCDCDVQNDSNCDSQLKNQHFNGPLGGYVRLDNIKQYSEVRYNGKIFSLADKNNVVFWEHSYCKICNILQVDEHVVFLVKRFLQVSDVFDYPCASSAVGISFVDKNLVGNLVNVHIREVTKCWLMSYDDKPQCYVVKLLHKH